MITSDRIRKDVKAYLSSERYDHTIRVERESIRLGESLGFSGSQLEKVRTASLLHDIGKSKHLEELLGDSYGNYQDLLEKLGRNGAIYHAHIGVEIAKNRYRIEDDEVLDAIRYHTTGRANMKVIEKVVYLSDYIEPGRSFEGLDQVRELAYRDIDLAMLMSLDKTIIHVIGQGSVLDEDTVRARNRFIIDSKTRGKGI